MVVFLLIDADANVKPMAGSGRVQVHDAGKLTNGEHRIGLIVFVQSMYLKGQMSTRIEILVFLAIMAKKCFWTLNHVETNFM